MRFEGSDASDAPGGGGGVLWESESEDMVVGGYKGALIPHVILTCRNSSPMVFNLCLECASYIVVRHINTYSDMS